MSNPPPSPPPRQEGSALIWTSRHETLRIEPWGPHSIRVRATRLAAFTDLPGALLPQEESEVEITRNVNSVELRNGKLTVRLSYAGRLEFLRSATGEILLEEPLTEILHTSGRKYRHAEGDLEQLEARFLAKEGESFYGLGQHRHGRLDQKGCVIDLVHSNCEIAIPFTLSNRGYGFLWHNPGVGRVELGHTLTRWVADASPQFDYWVTAGDSPKEILRHYAAATGFPPMLPEWAAGFWQCKLRYKNQTEVMEVAREHKRRGLPLSVIVIDFFHWPMMGDLCFDPVDWPDPTAMVEELEKMGIRVMISIWPGFNPNSVNCGPFRDRGYLLRTDRGRDALYPFMDTRPDGEVTMHFYDPTHPEARQMFWNLVKKNYLSHGIKIFWLDACEPDMKPADHANLRFHIGSGQAVASLYPLLHAKAFHDGMKAEGEEETVLLCRSAWAGSQRYGAAVWSGDIKSTFEVLTDQVKTGLNMALSGIPWWTTDIGGFHSGDPRTPYFRELIVRWFQYGVFCPLFRLHGVREPLIDHKQGGAGNEVWCFGDEAYEIIRELLFLRERLRPYILKIMQCAHEQGTPPMRPLFVDFPEDPRCWQVDDSFLFGPDLLVAPVTTQGTRERSVYLPAGEFWTHVWTGETHVGGQTLRVPAPLEQIPLYFRGEARLPITAD